MKLYIVGLFSQHELYKSIGIDAPFVLESFFYMQNDKYNLREMYPNSEIQLDSGAFTLKMSGDLPTSGIDDYVENYVKYINKYKFDLFYEMDIDKIIGYEKVKEYRKYIEDNTGKQSIPVWHKIRGYDDFIKTCDEYPLIAIASDIAKRGRGKKKIINGLSDEAHKHNCKIHFLGFTPSDLMQYRLDSVDSSAWLYGSKTNTLGIFNGEKIVRECFIERRRKDCKLINKHNMKQWILYSKYLGGK